MARIGVISDTHIPNKRKALPQALFDGLSGVDLIIHAGDINKDYVIYDFAAKSRIPDSHRLFHAILTNLSCMNCSLFKC